MFHFGFVFDSRAELVEQPDVHFAGGDRGVHAAGESGHLAQLVHRLAQLHLHPAKYHRAGR